MRLGKPTMRFHVFPRSWQGYQDSCHWGISKRAQIDETVILNENLEDDHTRGLSLLVINKLYQVY